MTNETTAVEASTALAGRSEFAFLCTDFIESIEDMSDELMARARVKLKNGYELSVIRGQYSYGGEQGLFEIAPFNLKGEMDGSLFDEDDQGDDVCGYCDVEKVNHYLKKLGTLGA